MWNEIKTKKDIETLLSVYGGWHDACIVEAKYVSGTIVEIDNLAMSLGTSTLTIVFQRQYRNPFSIEVMFENVKKIKFDYSTALVGASVYDATMFIHEGLIYWVAGWSENPSIDDIKDSDTTWLSCHSAKWRVVK